MPRIARFVVFALAALLFFGLPSALTLYTDWLWFGETGYRQIFATSLGTRLMLGAVTFLATFGWLLLNLRVALSSLRFAGPIVWTGQQGVQIELPSKQQLGRLAIGAAAIVALPAALYGASGWLTFLSWRHGLPFGSADPVLGYDVSFYLFTLPFIEFLRGALTVLVVLAALGAGAVYAVSGGVGLSPTGGVLLTRAAQRHLALLAAAFLLLLAVGAWLDIPRSLTTPAGIVHGVSYTDVAARFPVARALAAVSLLGAVLAVIAAYRRMTPLFVAIGLYLLVSLGGAGYAAAVQRFLVAPNELDRETPYIRHNVAATRRAFGLENVEERELTGRRGADPGRHPAERRHAAQRAPLGSSAPARHVRAAPGDPAVLRLRLGRQRSLHHQRRVPADHAVGPGTELHGAAQPQLDQRAARLHARVRPHAWAGQPGDAGRTAGAVRRRPAAGVHRRSGREGAEPLLRRAVERLRVRADAARGSSTTRVARTT